MAVATHINTRVEQKKYVTWKSVTAFFVVLIIAALVAARLYLGVWLLDYVNNVLANIPGYQGHVESIDISLYRGAYQINKLTINKKTGKIPTPFVSIDHTDLSLEWGALLHGRIVSSIAMDKPVINFAVNGEAAQTGKNVDWTKPIKDLMPIDINHVSFNHGSITYQDFLSTPKVDIYIHDMHGIVEDLRNVDGTGGKLPSTLTIEGSSIGNGHLRIGGRLNILKQVPDMDIDTELENVSLPAMNDYSYAYGAFKFADGDLNVYTHVTANNGNIGGYVKVLAHKLSIDVFATDNPLQVLWSGLVAGIAALFTNHVQDQFAAQTTLSGTLQAPDTDTLETLGSILQNAFVSALKDGLNGSGHGGVIYKPAQKP